MSTSNYTPEYIAHLNNIFPDYEHSLMKGRKYTRIVQASKLARLSARSVFAFIDNTTFELIKADSWSAPTKNSKGETFKKYFLNSEENYHVVLENTDAHGAFLYNDYPVRPAGALV